MHPHSRECLHEHGGLAMLFGNLAPDGAVVKAGGRVARNAAASEGPAVIFDSQEEAMHGILGGKVKAGDVVVIRYEGPKGGPGHAGDAGAHVVYHGHGAG